MDQPHTQAATPGEEPTSQLHINIVVEVDGQNKHVAFHTNKVTGLQIREKAGAPLTDDLVRLVHGQPTGGNIGLDDVVDIRNGDHFLALPTGTVS